MTSSVKVIETDPCKHLEVELIQGCESCRSCGYMIPDSKHISVSTAEVTYDSNGFGTVINKGGVNYVGKKTNTNAYRDLVNISQKARLYTSTAKNLYRGSLELERICNLVGLPEALYWQANAKFKEFCDSGKLKGRNLNACIICILLITAAEMDVPLAINQLLPYCAIDRRRVNREYYRVYLLYKEAPAISAAGNAHLTRMKGYIDSEWDNICVYFQELEKVLKYINYSYMVGRNAVVNCASVMHTLLRYYKYPKDEVFLRLVRVNRVTVENAWNELRVSCPKLLQYE